jgi:PAS domain S-box-containing protein
MAVSYVLAAFYLASVVCSLIVQHRLNNDYRQAFEKGQTWAERNKRFNKFGQEASLIEASGSQVTVASDVDAEMEKAREARQEFDEQFLRDQTDINTNVSGPDADKLLKDLKVVKSSMDSLTKETDAVFNWVRENKPEKAREHLAQVDQRYRSMIRAFFHLRDDVTELQKPHLEKLIASAEALERLQYVIASLLLIMVGALATYGHRLTRKIIIGIKEKENLLQQVHQAEDKYRSIVDNAIEGIFQSTPDGRYITANMALARMYGYEAPAELMGAITDIAHQLYVNPGMHDEILNHLERMGVVTSMEVEVYRKDGRTIWVSLNLRAVHGEAGGISYFEGTVEDITEQRWAEYRRNLQYSTTRVLSEAATVAEARPKILQTICEILDWDMGTVWDVDEQDMVLHCSEIWHRANIDIEEFERETSLLTFAKGTGLAGRVWESGEPAWLPDLANESGSVNAAIAAENGMQSAFCIPIKTLDKVLHVLEFFSPKASRPDPELLQTLAAIGTQLGQMIERKRGEEALRESEVRKGAILESALDCIITFDHDGRITEFNPAAERAFGYQRRNAIGREMVELIIPETLRDTHRRGLALYYATSSGPTLGRRIELTAMRANGAEFPVEMAISRINVNGKPMFTAYIRDITERKHAERVTSELASVVEFSNDAIIAKTLEGNILSWNAGAERIYGYAAEEVIGRHVYMLIPPDRLNELGQTLATVKRGESLVNFETVQMRKDGKRIWVSLTESPIKNETGKITAISSIARDITENKRLEEQFLQSQKMEAVGRLAGGVAHDFNNILTAILGYSDLLLAQMNSSHPMYKSLSEIRRAGEFAASLTHQLLAFSRRQSLQLKILDINDVVKSIEKMLKRLIGEDIQIMTVLDTSVGKIKADPSQLEQVVLNLAVNARDAMPKGGVITIQTSNATLLADDLFHANEMPAGEYVKLMISDTGCGMSDEVKKHLFEPFFTTKDQGKGTGLGLATCYGIVKQCGGHIMVESVEGQGTTFVIYFPRTEIVGEKSQGKTNLQELPRGNETVLIVEDEVTVRSLAAHILRRLGYNVLEAEDAGSAREVVKSLESRRIDLLLADVVLPNSEGGKELADWLEELHEETKVLFTSGYVEESVFKHHGLEPGMAFLQKPFTPADLAKRVREVIEG